MTLKEVINELAALGNEKLKAQNQKRGVDIEQYGVKLGDLRKLAKKIKQDQSLALELWDTGVYEARLLAILILDPQALSAEQVDAMVRSVKTTQVADWINSYVVKEHPENESLRLQWMQSADPMAARAGWNLTAQRIVRKPETVDLDALLDRIESEMAAAHPWTQWTMNFALAYIGIHHPSYRERALDIGESLGVYRDYPVSKGCTSPFAPIWIEEMVSRAK